MGSTSQAMLGVIRQADLTNTPNLSFAGSLPSVDYSRGRVDSPRIKEMT